MKRRRDILAEAPLCFVALGGNSVFPSPPLAKAVRDTEENEVGRKKQRREEEEKVGGVQTWHTLLPSPCLLAGKLSDTTDYSSHYSQRLTSASVCTCVCVCLKGLVSTVNCVNMLACLLPCDLLVSVCRKKCLILDHRMHSRKYLRMQFDQITFDLTRGFRISELSIHVPLTY